MIELAESRKLNPIFNKLYLYHGSGYGNQKSHFVRLQMFLSNLWINWKRYSSLGTDRIPLLQTQIRHIEGDLEIFLQSLILWCCSIGNFGVGIASFFVFTRFVIALNIVLAVLWTCFVILPGAIEYDREPSSVENEDIMEIELFHVKNLFDGMVCLLHTTHVYT